MENANTSSGNITTVQKLLEGEDCYSACTGGEDDRQSHSLIRLIIRADGKSVQFQIAAAESGKVYVVGSLNKMDPTTRPLSSPPDIFVFRAAMFLPFGTR